MATTKSKATPTEMAHDPSAPTEGGSFDVTCVVGTVNYSPHGEGDYPHVAAYKMIAEHDSEGVYTFPMPDGRTNRVTVEFIGSE